MTTPDERVHLAHGDAWQAEGRLRARFGGGAVELAGARLSSSGLPHPQWNNGDLVELARFDLEAVRAWYAMRAHGAGVPWGMRVPSGVPFQHGRFLFTTIDLVRTYDLAAPIFYRGAHGNGVKLG